jgi:large subunit ribosomal protein L22
MRFTTNPNPKKSAKVYGRGIRVSTKSSIIVCKAIRGMRLEKGKSFLQALLDQKRSIAGKYYTNTTKQVLNLIKSAEANAEGKGLDTENLHIHVTAHTGFTFYRPRGWKRRREQAKVTNLQVVLEAR